MVLPVKGVSGGMAALHLFRAGAEADFSKADLETGVMFALLVATAVRLGASSPYSGEPAHEEAEEARGPALLLVDREGAC